jgi:hypothetical protein
LTAEAASAGVYRVRAVRDGGITGEGSGTDTDALIAEYRRWALRVESDLAERKQQTEG